MAYVLFTDITRWFDIYFTNLTKENTKEKGTQKKIINDKENNTTENKNLLE